MFNLRRLGFALVALLISTQAQAACWQWSRTSSANATADPTINWSVGMAPSAVDASGRAMMARTAECRDDLSGLLQTTGTSTAYAVTTYEGIYVSPVVVPQNGQQLVVRLNVANGAAPTLAADGGTAYAIQTAPGTAVASGVLVAGTPYRLTFNLSATAWVLQGFYNSTLGPAAIATSNLQDQAVTYAKFQLPSTTSRLIGTPSVASQNISTTANNGSGAIRLTVASTTGYVTGDKKTVSGVVGTTEANGFWTITVVDATHIDLQSSTFTNVYVSGGFIGGFVEEISLGTGLQIAGNVLSAPATPVPGGFKNLAIKVASNTTATVTADFVTTTNGTQFQTTAVSCTINFASTGINGIDVGSVATSTWYYIWIDVKADATTGCTASLQSTANATFLTNLPSGYTYYARVGAVRTASGVAQLMGTWQFGRRTQYVVGLAQTANMPIAASGTAGSTSVPTWSAISVSSYVPSTAGVVNGSMMFGGGSTNDQMMAPNNSYGASTSTTNPPPLMFNTSAATGNWPFSFLLESTNIYWASANSNARVMVSGWEDNL